MIAAFAAMAAGAAASAMGSYLQGKSSRNLANYNARVAEMEGRAAIQDARSNVRSTQNRTRQALGQQRNIMANTSLTSGSFSRLEDQSAIAGALDALKIRYGGVTSDISARNQAALMRASGKAAHRGGVRSSIGTLLTGSAQATSSYYGAQRPQVQSTSNVNKGSVMGPR
jgi:hypothetical protein